MLHSGLIDLAIYCVSNIYNVSSVSLNKIAVQLVQDGSVDRKNESPFNHCPQEAVQLRRLDFPAQSEPTCVLTQFLLRTQNVSMGLPSPYVPAWMARREDNGPRVSFGARPSSAVKPPR